MKTYLAGAIILAGAASAVAADLPVRVAPVFVPAPPAPMWTGPFIGLGIGGVFGGDGGNSLTGKGLYCVNGPGAYEFCNSQSYGPGFGSVAGGASPGNSFAVSPQLGYNFQVSSNFVIGGVVDFTWMDRSRSRSLAGPAVTIQDYTERTFYEDAFRQDWLATARVKVGVTFDNLMVFATGGLAMANVKSSSSTSTTWTGPETVTVAQGAGSTSGTALGWAAGAGIEYRFAPNWSLFAEYLYYSLGDSYNVNVSTTPRLGSPSSSSYRVKADASGSLIKVGVNYHFWTPVAYVAPTVISVRN